MDEELYNYCAADCRGVSLAIDTTKRCDISDLVYVIIRFVGLQCFYLGLRLAVATIEAAARILY